MATTTKKTTTTKTVLSGRLTDKASEKKIRKMTYKDMNMGLNTTITRK